MNICTTQYIFRSNQVVGLLADTKKISYGHEIVMVSKMMISLSGKEMSAPSVWYPESV